MLRDPQGIAAIASTACFVLAIAATFIYLFWPWADDEIDEGPFDQDAPR